MPELLPGRSIFHRVATKEDDYTQLLCNLIQRRDGNELRTSVLSVLLGLPDMSSRIGPEQISTQMVLEEAGRPDLTINSSIVRAAIEVKLNPRRGCTPYQVPTLNGYCRFLNDAPASRKVLAFLVPADWQYRQDIENKLAAFERDNPSINTRVALWETIFGLHKRFLRDPLHVEFWRLLQRDFSALEFSTREIEMAVNGIGLPIRTFNKSGYVVDWLAAKCERSGFSIDKPKHQNSGEEYGIWFYTKRKGRDRGDAYFFWFGILSPYWEKRGKALCFGITNDKEAEKAAFLQSYSGDTEEFCNGMQQSAADVYTLGWVSESDLVEDPSGREPAEKIWEWLRPILDRVSQAGERNT